MTDHTDPSTPLDHSFEVLTHSSRRRTLLLLAGVDPGNEITVEDIATEGDDLDRLTADLHHTHLPMLAAAGYVTWQTETESVAHGPKFDEVEPLLRLLGEYRADLPDGWP